MRSFSLRDDLRALQRWFDSTAIFVTHDHEEALVLSDRVVVMNLNCHVTVTTRLYEPLPMDMQAQRQDWMRVVAHAEWAELEPLWVAVSLPADAKWLRPPETGMVMVRARAGGAGLAFNTGEATVTRCAVQISDGVIGHSYILGRNAEHARAAAMLDALMQMPERVADTRAQIVEPLRMKIAARREIESRKAAATRVDFFTLVRGED